MNKNHREDEFRRQYIAENYGTRCVCCGTSRGLCMHCVSGDAHEDLFRISRAKFFEILNRYEFVRLCRACHSLVHQKRQYYRNLDLEKVLELQKRLGLIP